METLRELMKVDCYFINSDNIECIFHMANDRKQTN